MDQTEALQAALAGEHAAIYAVGVAGGHLHGGRFTAAGDLLRRHRERRERLDAMVVAAGAEPVAAAPAYDLPSAVTTPAGATALLRLVEQRLAAVYADLVEAATDTPARSFAVQSLVSCANDQARWGAGPTAFPGSV
jgi:Domain of unknown function (DUF4439)